MPAVEVSPSLVTAAVGGDQRALEQLLRAVAEDVHRLALRMLWHPQDAEDATQEILVKVATRLSTFRGDARVATWVHRIAVNHLLTTRRRRADDPTLTFAAFGEDLARDLDATYDSRGVDDELLAQEVMVGCTQGMLLCLDREHRTAYILGDVLAGSLIRPTHAAAGAASALPSGADASTPTTSCSRGESTRSSSICSASPTPARSFAATPSYAHRQRSLTQSCAPSGDSGNTGRRVIRA